MLMFPGYTLLKYCKITTTEVKNMFESFNFASCCRTVHYKYTPDSCWRVSIRGSSIKAAAQLVVLEILNHTTALKQE